MSVASTTKKVLITGANGFTGRHLASLLGRDDSLELSSVDRTSPDAQSEHFHVCDFRDAAAVSKLVLRVLPNEVYHTIGAYTNDYDIDYASNVLTAKHILDALRAGRISCRVLLVGSSAEYGFPDNPENGVPETHPLRPVSIYGLAKVYLTRLMECYVRLYDMDIIAVRPFNLHGRGISRTLFPGNLGEQIEKYKRGKLLTITTGDLSVERDYLAIEKAVQYYAEVMKRGVRGEIYNVGSGTSTSLRTVLAGMLREADIPVNAVREGCHETPGKIVVPKIFANISKLRAL